MNRNSLTNTNKFLVLIGLGVLLALTGCGGGDADPAAAEITAPVFGGDETGASYLGADRCLNCHQQYTPEPVSKYLASRHVQPGTVDAGADPACLSCHDPLGDGPMIAPWLSGVDLPPAGLAAVGCENCHGAGPQHLTMIPAHPNSEPDFNACGQCHTALPSGPAGHIGKLTEDILAKYQASAHGSSLLAGITLPLCARCHSDQGFRAYGPQTVGMEGAELENALNGAATVANPAHIQCRTCHDGHNGELRAQAAPGFSRQFNLCAACHQVFLTTTFSPTDGVYSYLLDTDKTPFHGSLDDSGRPLFDGRVIWDTHFPTEDGRIIGYRVNPAAANACTLCHDPHAAINW